MITNRDLDRQLGTWFEARATSLPPDGLLERAMADVGSTRQRPGWLVPDRWRSSDGRTRPTSTPARVTLVLVALLVVAIAATAVGAWLNRPSALIVPPAPSPSAVVAATPLPSEAAPSPTAEPTPTPTRATSVRTGTFAGLSDFLAASDRVAWAATPLGLYRTQDTGKTWTDVDPQGWSSHTAVSLVDADTVYVASGGSPSMIIATHDGGATFVGASLEVGASYGGPVFQFQTSGDGFATFYDLSDTKPMHVYATTDGGVTWTGPKGGKVPHLEASMDKLYPPTGGFLVQSGGKFDNKPFDNRFFMSADGGATWTQYTFPIGGALSPKDVMKQVEGIVREDNGRFLLAMNADGGRHPIPDSIYESGDDTSTWRHVQTLPSGGVNLEFLSPTTWVIFSTAPSEVRSTVDGGVHWRVTTPAISLYYMDAHFATPDTGWATQDCHKSWPAVGLCDKGRDGLVLGVTTDGGRTWTRIGD